MTNTAKVRKFYTIQERMPSGAWRMAGLHKSAISRQEATAMKRMIRFGEINPEITFRLVDSTGAILAVRAPSVINDRNVIKN